MHSCGIHPPIGVFIESNPGWLQGGAAFRPATGDAVCRVDAERKDDVPCASLPTTAFRLERRVEAFVDSLAKMRRFTSGGLHGWPCTMLKCCCCVLSFHLLKPFRCRPQLFIQLGARRPTSKMMCVMPCAWLSVLVTASVDLRLPLHKPLFSLFA